MSFLNVALFLVVLCIQDTGTGTVDPPPGPGAPGTQPEPDCWKTVGSVHCAEDSTFNSGTPLAHQSCAWSPTDPNVPFAQACTVPPNSLVPRCPNPYYEEYADDPFVHDTYEKVTNGIGKQSKSTSQNKCYIRFGCTCSPTNEDYPQYPFGICVSDETHYGSEPSDHFFYRTQPVVVGIDCEKIDPTIAIGG